jgi:hypothetical protein
LVLALQRARKALRDPLGLGVDLGTARGCLREQVTPADQLPKLVDQEWDGVGFHGG